MHEQHVWLSRTKLYLEACKLSWEKIPTSCDNMAEFHNISLSWMKSVDCCLRINHKIHVVKLYIMDPLHHLEQTCYFTGCNWEHRREAHCLCQDKSTMLISQTHTNSRPIILCRKGSINIAFVSTRLRFLPPILACCCCSFRLRIHCMRRHAAVHIAVPHQLLLRCPAVPFTGCQRIWSAVPVNRIGPATVCPSRVIV